MSPVHVSLVGVQVFDLLDGCPVSRACPWVGMHVPSGCPWWVSPACVCVCVFVPDGCPGRFPDLCHLVVLCRVGSVGGWSARGCEVTFRNQSHVSCQCHHLTSFAVLMDISRREVGTEEDTEGYMGTEGDWCDTGDMEGHSDPGAWNNSG